MGATADPAEGRLAHFPVWFFAVSMGLAGLTLALAAGERLGAAVSGAMPAATAAAFAAIAGGLALRRLVAIRAGAICRPE